MIRAFVFGCFLFLVAQVSLAAAPMCPAAFVQPARIDASENSETQLLRFFQQDKVELWSAIESLQEPQRVRAEQIVNATEFFDYQHMVSRILPKLLGEKSGAIEFKDLYDAWGEAESPFSNYVAARSFLRASKPPVEVETLLRIHSLLMKGGIESVPEAKLGKFRSAPMFGNCVQGWEITTQQVNALRANPYLSFPAHDAAAFLSSESHGWKDVRLWTRERKKGFSKEDRRLVTGSIFYPSVKNASDALVETIKTSHPEIYRDVSEARSTGTISGDLESRFTEALTRDAFSHFMERKQQLGPVRIGENERAYVEIVADFQRDLVSIHPVWNGNGRSTRLFMNYLLTREGLPPARVLDPNADILTSREQWREMVWKGVLSTARLYDDLLTRFRDGRPLEFSPELLYPDLKDSVEVALSNQGERSKTVTGATAAVDREQFSAFVKSMVGMHPWLTADLETEKLQTMSRLAELFAEFYQSKTIDYMHSKDGKKRVGLRLVTPDFLTEFFQPKAQSKQQWKDKIELWYQTDSLVWRGLSNSTAVITDSQLLDYFRNPSQHLVSNRVLNGLRSGKSIQELILADFESYNRDLISGDFVQMAVDHHTTGPLYASSYGYSTSKREIVGKAFAMGAMVVAKYGEHRSPEAQSRLLSRINIGFYRAEKDVDLGRLKAFDPEFSYKYGRQAEVMGIGGVDPDSIMVIQRIDASGEVETSFVRSLDNPNIILEIAGRYIPGEPLSAERIRKNHELFVAPKTSEKTDAAPVSRENLPWWDLRRWWR